MIQPKIYTVIESRECAEAVLKPEAARDYAELKKAWAQKGDLKKFHIENSKILYPPDGLLESTGINHLHLDRARLQVFFLERDRHIHVIKIVKHFERNRMSHSKENLLHVLRENWPDLPLQPPPAIGFPERLTQKYAGRYGWGQYEELLRWLAGTEALLPGSGGGEPFGLAFEDNERFTVRAADGTPVGVSFGV